LPPPPVGLGLVEPTLTGANKRWADRTAVPAAPEFGALALFFILV
jgi:hypothetical protein